MTQTEWIVPPTFADGNLLSASDMNIIAHDIELLKGTVDGTQALFSGFQFNSSDAYRQVFYKHANLGYLYYWFEVPAGTADVELYITDAQVTNGWGSDYFGALSYGALDSGDGQLTGHVDISGLTDNTWYMLSFDVSFASSGQLMLHCLELKSTNS